MNGHLVDVRTYGICKHQAVCLEPGCRDEFPVRRTNGGAVIDAAQHSTDTYTRQERTAS